MANKKVKPDYKKEKCDACGQFTTYLLPVDRGTATIVKAVSVAIRRKGINVIHPTKEMEVPLKQWSYLRAIHEGVLTSNHLGNLTRARAHGLLARVKGEAGNWLLTPKGAAFLRGTPVPHFAIIKKSRDGDHSHKEEYFEPEKFQITVGECAKQDENWEAIDFDIVEGRIVQEKDLPPKKVGLFENKN